ncbi:MAG: pyruvate dehydrogenase complex dihydrolipoamide acetyltransferase [Parachlamydia sp.]|jgi:pyruvate dehydrogenase E2 component (dihydrolipoamide acetyltransferase)|nr:pyruvate dehydrogenase complex dihydrolipoamide acetyltransferase [Parachlamydia sp.]
MPFTLTMPKLSPTMEEGTIVKWHKKPGDSIQPGDLLMEIATDKATVEHQALDEGFLRKIIIEEGQSAHVNQAIAIVSESLDESIEEYQPEGEALKPLKKQDDERGAEQKEGVQEEKPKAQSAALQQPDFVPEPPLENYQFAYPTERIEKRMVASPLAKKLAKEKGLDLTSIQGTGPHKRIMSRDLQKAQPAHPFSKRNAPDTPPGSYEQVPLTPMRKVIAQRLQESKSFIPHFYVSLEVDAAPLLAIKEQLMSGEIKVSVNDLVVRAVALGLKKHPQINTGYNSLTQSIIQFKTVDIAIAVSLESGLITPIIRHADYKSVGEVAAEIRYLAKKAREGKLEAEEYKGGSFTISNLGMFGISHFQAIINPPQAAILAVGGIRDVPIIKNSGVVPGNVMTLTLSVDHRVIDGVAASQFLNTLQKFIENPALLVF